MIDTPHEKHEILIKLPISLKKIGLKVEWRFVKSCFHGAVHWDMFSIYRWTIPEVVRASWMVCIVNKTLPFTFGCYVNLARARPGGRRSVYWQLYKSVEQMWQRPLHCMGEPTLGESIQAINQQNSQCPGSNHSMPGERIFCGFMPYRGPFRLIAALAFLIHKIN